MARFIILLFTSAVLISCQTYFELQLPEQEPRFVINAELQVGRPVHVFVSQSRNVLQEGVFPDIEDATVELLEEDGQAYFLQYEQLDSEAGLFGYTSQDIEIQPGKSYQLVVSKPGMPTATGKVSIPDPVAIEFVELRTTTNSLNHVITTFSINFEDSVEKNFYEIGVSYRGEIDYGLSHGPWVFERIVKLEAVNPFYQQEHLDGDNLLLNDALFNGHKTTIEVTGLTIPHVELEIEISLKSLSKEYYDYINTLNSSPSLIPNRSCSLNILKLYRV